MNPPFPLPVLIPITALTLMIVGGTAWRRSAGLSIRTRGILSGLRLLGVGIVFAVLCNPGKWVAPNTEHERPWVVLTDVSASMARTDDAGTSRAATAAKVVHAAARQAERENLTLRVQPFAIGLSAATPPAALPQPDGAGSHILSAVSRVLEESGATGESLAGVLVVSDGRETLPFSQPDLDAISLRARSRGIAVHTVAIGSDGPPPDLTLIQPRASLTAFGGQPLKIPFALKSQGLGPLRPTVTLRDADGNALASVAVDLAPSATVTAVLETPAPAASTGWTLETPVVEGEVRAGNNRAQLGIRITSSRTRVFLVEGSPYWDSKFLAQLLRQQPNMDVRSVHRLSDQRYFRIDSDTPGTSETRKAVFPATLDELRTFDLIVFGKNVEPFLTPERTDALRAYVRDHGGAILFARGKPTSASVAGLEPLEPVTWGTATTTDFRFTPTRDGSAAGLFGEALPAPDASLWSSLPTLRDARQVSWVKPFTRILAEGVTEGPASPPDRFPVLLMSRHGQGVTGLINGDGLWKWDFFPEARELGNCYEDFWVQLIQWMATYSEFLPGQDFSLRLPASRGELGEVVAASISYRGPEPAPQPLVHVTGPDGNTSDIQPAAVRDPSGRTSWRASFTPDTPGMWRLAVTDPRENAPPAPEALFNVPCPPAETDDLSADPEFLATLARTTGGEAMNAAAFPDFITTKLVKLPPERRQAGAVWQASWDHSLVAIAIAAILASEWLLRRRNGLS